MKILTEQKRILNYLWNVSDSRAMKRFRHRTADRASQKPTRILAIIGSTFSMLCQKTPYCIKSCNTKHYWYSGSLSFSLNIKCELEHFTDHYSRQSHSHPPMLIWKGYRKHHQMSHSLQYWLPLKSGNLSYFPQRSSKRHKLENTNKMFIKICLSCIIIK